MIRLMTDEDFAKFWPTFEAIINARETYAFDPLMTQEAACALWCHQPLRTYVFEQDGQILGSYYLKPNAMGPGSHVCNCGYMVSEAARGRGVAKAMCEHSQQIARELGFKAMQFNSVVSSNHTAIALWEKLGFAKVGVLPKAYQHARLGFVDCFVMFKTLEGA